MCDARLGLVCGEVFNLLESQGPTSSTSQQNGDVGSPRLEMGRDYNGYYPQIALHGAWSRFDMGHRRSIHQESAFYSDQGEYFGEKLADIYVREVVERHGMSVSVVYDRGVRFTSKFWKRFYMDLGTRLHFGTTFHPQTDAQSERTI